MLSRPAACALICALLLVSAQPASADPTPLRVLTYDVFQQSPSASVDGQAERNSRIPEAIRTLEVQYGTLDVLVLTGSFIKPLRQNLLSMLQQDGWLHHSDHKIAEHYMARGDGTVIVSRWPIKDQGWTILSVAHNRQEAVIHELHYAQIEKTSQTGETLPVKIFALSLPIDEVQIDNWANRLIDERRLNLRAAYGFMLINGMLSDTFSIVTGDFAEPDNFAITTLRDDWQMSVPPHEPGSVLTSPQTNRLIGRRFGQAYVHGCLFGYRWRGVCSCCTSPDTLRIAWRVGEQLGGDAATQLGSASSRWVPLVAPPFGIPWDRGTKTTEFLSDTDALLTTFYFSAQPGAK